MGLDSETTSSSQIQTGMNPNMAAVVQQQQQQIMMMQAQMQQMQMSGNARYMMMQQQQRMNSSNSVGATSTMGGIPMKHNIMGASNGSGVATSFAFMEDPSKARREATNKKFEFVQDAMKGAK